MATRSGCWPAAERSTSPFPALYASSFSGFYLPLMVVLWLLILRGIAIEFREHVQSLVWQPLWDAVFSLASALLGIFFGAALGNVVRGVPLDRAGTFFLPLWTDFSVGKDAGGGILDWYTVLVAIAALATLVVHGALWIALKTEGALELRARRTAGRAWWGLAASVILITFVSFRIQPHLRASFEARPWGCVFPILAVTGLVGAQLMNHRQRELGAFLCSCVFIVGAAHQRRVRRVSQRAAFELRPRAVADGFERGRFRSTASTSG